MKARGTELRTFRRCRLKWHWSYVELLHPKRKKGALTFGTLIHKALEARYPPGIKRGPHPATIFERVFVDNVNQFDQWDEEGNRIDALELGIGMLQGYVNRYGEDDQIEIIMPEQTFQVPVYDSKGNLLCTFVGTFDALARSRKTGRLFIFEHKTAKSIKHVRINSGYGDQGLGYCWAANQWLRTQGIDETVDGVMYNFLRKGLPTDKPVDAMGRALNKPRKETLLAECAKLGVTVVNPRTVQGAIDTLRSFFYTDQDIALLGKPSKVQPAPLFLRQELLYRESELRTFEERLIDQLREMRLVKRGKLPVYKNPTQDCDWDCPFKDPCEVHEMSGDYPGILAMEFSQWNPYSEHELEEELKS